MEIDQSLAIYANQRNEYLFNAEKYLSNGKHRKASELYWGAVTQTIKGLALLYNQRLGSHNSIRKFIKEIVIQTHDDELLVLFDVMEKFHINFYDEVLDLQDVTMRVDKVKLMLHKLDTLAQQKYNE